MKKIFINFTILTLSLFMLGGLTPALAVPELVANGSFEEPIVGAPEMWDVYLTAAVPGWTIEWMPSIPLSYDVLQRPDPQLELHRGVNGWLPQIGDQYAELDTDWDGPTGSVTGEPASVKIYQDISTSPGTSYKLKFSFSPRPGTPEADNVLKIEWNGSEVATLMADGSGNGNNVWQDYEYELSATGATTRLAFSDMGASNALGTFLDNVSLTEIEEEEPDEPECCFSSDIISNNSEACVMNDVTARAETGGNVADGSYGGSGGRGGSIRNNGGDVEKSMTGSGGNGGSAGSGGTIITGNATAAAALNNDVNSNDIAIDRCACQGGDDECNSKCGDTVTANSSRTRMFNRLLGKAETGENESTGSYGGSAGNGGNIENETGDDVEESTTGNGGNGGSSAAGGLVTSGASNSTAALVNVINRNMIRIYR